MPCQLSLKNVFALLEVWHILLCFFFIASASEAAFSAGLAVASGDKENSKKCNECCWLCPFKRVVCGYGLMEKLKSIVVDFDDQLLGISFQVSGK